MYAFKNHLWVCSAEEHLTTSGNHIIATFVFKCVLGPNGSRPIVAKLEHEICIKKKIESNFEALNIVVFFKNWVKANYIKNSATIKIDEHIFTFVNLNSLIPIFD
jgi:hypothetical protein